MTQAFANHYKFPWVVMWDLNFILTQEEKEGGNQVSQSQLDISNALLDNASLHSLSYIGNPFTWTNRRKGQELILEKLDRVLASLDWINMFHKATMHHLIAVASDH